MRKIKITGIPPTMSDGGGQGGYGTALSGTGYNINSQGRANPIKNQEVDTLWRYFSPADVYAYKKDGYGTKRTLPESEDPDIVVEKNEQIIGDFNGDGNQELMEVNTGSHDSGNDQGINVPDGSFVFSDTPSLKIKDKEVLKNFDTTKSSTPAKLAKKYNLQKYSAMIKDPTNDNLTKKTAQMMYENNMNKLTQIADIQEGMKQSKQVRKDMRKMADGGKVGPVLPQYTTQWTLNQYGVPEQEAVLNESTVTAKRPASGMYTHPMVPVGVSDDQIEHGRWYNLPKEGAETSQVDPWLDFHPHSVIPPAATPYQVPATNPENTADNNVAGSKKKIKISGLPAGTIGDIALGLKAANLRKFKPWEPPVTAVIPDAVYMDPTRELAANSEQAAMAYNNALQSGNPRIARAVGTVYQGQALSNAANILGKYNNANVEIANRANQVAAGITNERMAQERERVKSLNSDIFNANRLYQGELNQLTDEMVKRAYQKEDDERNRAWINQTNKYYQLDKRGMPVFRSDNAREEFMRMTEGKGSAPSEGAYKRILDNYIAQGYSPEDAKDYAQEDYNDLYRASMGIGSKTRTQKKEGKTTTTTITPGKKTGGFSKKAVANFMTFT